MTLSDWRRRKLAEFHIGQFYYFSLISNLAPILTYGIISKNEVARRGLHSWSFADESVQEKRHIKIVELSSRAQIELHDLVPVYLTPRTPTLSARRNIQNDMVFIVVDSGVICDEKIEFAFTDGNAGSQDTSFFRNLYKLSEIPWKVINADYWNDFSDGKRQRNAEFLIYPRIQKSYFKKIVVNNHLLQRIVENRLVEMRIDIPAVVDTSYFFV